jgi:hypothetical protein
MRGALVAVGILYKYGENVLFVQKIGCLCRKPAIFAGFCGVLGMKQVENEYIHIGG